MHELVHTLFSGISQSIQCDRRGNIEAGSCQYLTDRSVEKMRDASVIGNDRFWETWFKWDPELMMMVVMSFVSLCNRLLFRCHGR
jgi:hypothetical protein